MEVRGPYLKYNCSGCGHPVFYSVSSKRIEEEIEEMIEREGRLCAQCSYIEERYNS